MDRETVIVFSGGEPVAGPLPHLDGSFVIAADSGLEAAQHLGVAVDLVVGDLDSVDPDTLRRAVSAGASVERHPAAKDATDLELALAAAAARGPRRIVLYGGWGGRFDHLLGNTLALAAPALDGISVEWHADEAVVHTCRAATPVTIRGAAGDVVSLVPLGGEAAGVTTRGLAWALEDDRLEPGSTRGISNEMTDDTAHVDIESGIVLVVHNPGSRER